MPPVVSRRGFWHSVCLSLTRRLHAPDSAGIDLQVRNVCDSVFVLFKILEFLPIWLSVLIDPCFLYGMCVVYQVLWKEVKSCAHILMILAAEVYTTTQG